MSNLLSKLQEAIQLSIRDNSGGHSMTNTRLDAVWSTRNPINISLIAQAVLRTLADNIDEDAKDQAILELLRGETEQLGVEQTAINMLTTYFIQALQTKPQGDRT